MNNIIDFNSKLIEIESPYDTDLLTKAIIANALSIENISASNLNLRKTFENLLGPINGIWDLNRKFQIITIDNKITTQGISTCGLVAEGLWRRMNIDFPALYKNYVFGTAISRSINFAKSLKPRSAFQIPKDDLRPEPGDYIIIGSGNSTHAFTCIDWEDDYLISIDGGQTDYKNLQCILRKKRIWKKIGNKFYLGDREVVGWICFTLLPFKSNTIVVPENWDSI
jgi:hypothetical protein